MKTLLLPVVLLGIVLAVAGLTNGQPSGDPLLKDFDRLRSPVSRMRSNSCMHSELYAHDMRALFKTKFAGPP